MKKTGSLKVSVSGTLDREHLIMHPNEGFDLGLLRVEHTLKLCLDLKLEAYLKGDASQADFIRLALKNDCPRDTLVVGTALHHLLGEPAKVVVLFDGNRLYVQGQPS